VITRENKALRWELENHKCLCYICHKWFHDNPTESGEWFKKTYPERYKYIQKHLMDIQKTDAASLRTKLEILTTIAIMRGVL
jgi:5-methylcytosine-specific restriction endonuclease McrA